ncbi:MAG: PDZ domain-containing protein [Ruminococcus sp.]|jgi:carboxyl-terminal processing protease|nr:PDZ domain-containing protein [Ruminococcus sp.]
MNKKISVGISVAIAAIAAAIAVIVTYNYTLTQFNDMLSGVSQREQNYTRISELDSYVRGNYIGTPEEKTLLDSILRGYIVGIGDPYARYYTSAETVAQTTSDTGFIMGLGFTYEKDPQGYIKIIDVREGSDAEEKGIRAGDVIAAVNNNDVMTFQGGYDEAVLLMNGPEGTRVKLYIKRIAADGVAEYTEYELTTTRTEIFTVFGEIAEGFGYIRITGFNDRTGVQLKNISEELIKQGAKALIIDLRGNTGGTIANLQSSVDVILGAGDVVTAVYKSREEVVVRTTEADFINMKTVVLVDDKTAGTAELFAFALRDHALAQIVGTATAGQGLLQETHKLGSGGSVKISVASLKTKSSGNFDKVGVKPDFEVKLPDGITLEQITPSNRMINDTQFAKAVEVAGTL